MHYIFEMYVVNGNFAYILDVDMVVIAMDVNLMNYIAYLYMVPAIDCNVERVEAFHGKVDDVYVADSKNYTDNV